MRNLVSKKYFTHILTAVVFCICLSVSEYIYILNYQQQKSVRDNEVFNTASSLRLCLEREINTTMSLTMGLILFVSASPDFKNSQFQRIAQDLLDKAPHVRNVGLARNNVISHVYPLKGNEQALGLDYMATADQRDSILRAIEERNSVIAGPVELVQGGTAFISRVPIFNSSRPDQYWGMASVVINAEKIYGSCGLLDAGTSMRYSLRGKDALGEKGAVFYGPASLFREDQSIRMPISLPVGSWELAARPASAQGGSMLLMALRAFGVFFALIVSGMVYMLLASYRRINFLALHDSLTGLANRRLFFEYLKQAVVSAQRNKQGFSVIYFDLNNFKPVNDTYGHKYGDEVLIEVASRMKRGLRNSDITARFGGDEFVLLLMGVTTRRGVEHIFYKLQEIISQPITLTNGQSVRVDASFGAGLFPEHGSSADELIRHADLAMYESKAAYHAKEKD